VSNDFLFKKVVQNDEYSKMGMFGTEDSQVAGIKYVVNEKRHSRKGYDNIRQLFLKRKRMHKTSNL
jgi:hypothetical protein